MEPLDEHGVWGKMGEDFLAAERQETFASWTSPSLLVGQKTRTDSVMNGHFESQGILNGRLVPGGPLAMHLVRLCEAARFGMGRT
jgi:hypothetical protein